MPRTSVIDNPVRHLRSILGLSRSEFAEKINALVARGPNKEFDTFSQSFLREIETKKQALPVRIANLLSLQYGVLPASLLQPTGHPLSLNGEILTKKTIESWQKIPVGENELTQITENLKRQLKTLLKLASKGSLIELSIVASKISDLFEDIRDQHHLKQPAEDYFKEKYGTKKDPCETSVEELRARFKGVPLWNEFSESIMCNLKGTIEEIHYPLWCKQGEPSLLFDAKGCFRCHTISKSVIAKDYRIFIQPKYRLNFRELNYSTIAIQPTRPMPLPSGQSSPENSAQ